MATPRLLWGEKRRERMEAGERSQGRNRGKGAQLRRRLRRQQEGIDRWRVEEREARKKVALAAARREADRTDVLARAWAEGRVLGKELRREEQEKLRRQMEMEAVDEPWPEREKLRRVKRAEEAVDAVKAKAVKAEVKAAVVLAQAWA